MIKLSKILKELKNPIREHYAGLKYPSGEDWKKTVAASKEYLTRKGVDPKTVAYWTRPETEQDHQENIHIPFVYNDAILGEVDFDFKYVKNLDPSSIKLDPNIAKEREAKFKKTLSTGEPFFKGIEVKGKNPEERLANIKKETSEYLKSGNSQPVTIVKVNGQNIIADGAHRVWIAQKLSLPLKAYVVTPN